MESRYIDANKLIKLMGETNTSILTADEIGEYADTQSEDVKPTVNATWEDKTIVTSSIEEDDEIVQMKCSNCKTYSTDIWSYCMPKLEYCSHCGARMEVKLDERIKVKSDGKSAGYHKCINCKWYERFVGVCTCPESEWRADFRDDDNVCERWEERR